ncbi:hypothetical protein CEP54_011483 [Fusarium duplospermum]|uniref:Amidase domain-containing protein n=1 Tax=Fusarium duplospermum TaxID=1325734 RepID=A0A428PE59_9HYPO|nr:hypothetical protein CEP54_011483 [Fusarium duplospermum]
MLTTRGSYAFKQGRPKKDSNLIHTLKAAGLIILAKENPSKLSNLKGWHQMAGWSAVGGQGPVGSSSGSAVSVAAGFAPVSLSTEFDGSIVMPAARAGLYAIKLFLKASTMTDSILEQLAAPRSGSLPSTGQILERTQDNALFSAQAKIEEAGGKVTRSVPVASWDDITGAMPNFSQEEELFLFNGVPQTLEELIKFNEDLADLEFTKRDNHQKGAGSRA